MQLRQNWLSRIQARLFIKRLLWLKGPWGVGKTSLVKQIPNTQYLNCRSVLDRETLGRGKVQVGQTIVIDEIGHLAEADAILKKLLKSELDFKIIAIGSIKWGDYANLRGSFQAQRSDLFLTPFLYSEMPHAQPKELEKRLFYGGIPRFRAEEKSLQSHYENWQHELISQVIEQQYPRVKSNVFRSTLERFIIESGYCFDFEKMSKVSGLTHHELLDLIRIFESAFLIREIRSFEARTRPDALPLSMYFFFDTGIISYLGNLFDKSKASVERLWKHLVVNEIMGGAQMRDFFHGQTKRSLGVDLIIPHERHGVFALKCPFEAKNFSVEDFLEFREFQPQGRNLVVSSDSHEIVIRRAKGLVIEFVPLKDLAVFLAT